MKNENFSENLANLEVLGWVISISINFLFLKSVIQRLLKGPPVGKQPTTMRLLGFASDSHLRG